jgi:hypothetical protein
LDAVKLAALQQAETSLLLPYQFYGNTLHSGLLFTVSRLVTSDPSLWMETAVWALVTLVAAYFLYGATRRTFRRYAEAVKAINAATPPPAATAGT